MTVTSDLKSLFRGRPPAKDSQSSSMEMYGDDEAGVNFNEVEFLDAPDHDLVGTIVGIEYIDSRGKKSMRTVTIKAFHPKEDHWTLYGYCFLKRAPRSFRLDRIKCVFDQDGVVCDPGDFFALYDLEYNGPVIDPVSPGTKQRAIARDGARVLAALARIDGDFHDLEKEVIYGYIEEEAAIAGIPPSEADRAALLKYISNLHPHGDVVNECIDRLSGSNAVKQRSFLRFVNTLIRVDDVVTDEEAAMALAIQTFFEERVGR